MQASPRFGTSPPPSLSLSIMEHMHKESNESSCKNKGHILFFYKGLRYFSENLPVYLLAFIIWSALFCGMQVCTESCGKTWQVPCSQENEASFKVLHRHLSTGIRN